MNWRDDALAHARAEYPREACGMVIVWKGREVYRPCTNVAPGTDHFMISPEDWAAAEDAGEIVGLFHSHPDASPQPSEADRVSCEQTGIEWHIVSVPVESWHSFKPSGYMPPLVGRQFQHGVLDCYSIIRDWFIQERGIDLGNYLRTDNWWLAGQNLYLDNADGAGFIRVTDGTLEPGDVLLMMISSPVPNHAAVYLGDGLILHHLADRLSSRDVYGGYYHKVTSHVFRYARN